MFGIPYSLTRDVFPLADKHVRSRLVNHSKFHSWNTIWNNNISGQCCRLIAGDTCALRQIKDAEPQQRDDCFYAQFNSCASIQAKLYNNYYVSQREKSSPLAYVALVHKEPRMLLRFLKAVYRRHNAYCIHYDQKSSPRFKAFIHQLSICVDNVLLSKKFENVVWGDSSLLNAQLNCFRELLTYRSSVPWQYAFNLQGHELPLRTNRELVEMLLSQPPNTSIVETWPVVDGIDQERLTYQYRQVIVAGISTGVSLSSERLTPLPSILDLEIFKSWCFIAATPDYVHFMLESDLSKKLLDFLQYVSCGEEYFYATLYNHKLTPGVGMKGPMVFPMIHLLPSASHFGYMELWTGRNIAMDYIIMDTVISV